MKALTPLSHRECELISYLGDGMSWEQACDEAGVPRAQNSRRQARFLILQKIGVRDLTSVVLWASRITDAELERLTGRTPRLSRSAGAG